MQVAGLESCTLGCKLSSEWKLKTRYQELPTFGIRKGVKMGGASEVNGHLRDTAGAGNCRLDTKGNDLRPSKVDGLGEEGAGARGDGIKAQCSLVRGSSLEAPAWAVSVVLHGQ